MNKTVSTKFNTMYLVSGTYLEDCESRTTQNEPPTSVIQTQTSPQTDTPQTDTTQNVSQHNIENSIGDGFHCDHMLGNNKLCGQKFDSAQNLENHKISTHSPAGPSKTMTETVTEAALRVDKDANLDPIIDPGTLKCKLCPFTANTEKQLDTHHVAKHLNSPASERVLTGHPGAGIELNHVVPSWDDANEEGSGVKSGQQEPSKSEIKNKRASRRFDPVTPQATRQLNRRGRGGGGYIEAQNAIAEEKRKKSEMAKLKREKKKQAAIETLVTPAATKRKSAQPTSVEQDYEVVRQKDKLERSKRLKLEKMKKKKKENIDSGQGKGRRRPGQIDIYKRRNKVLNKKLNDLKEKVRQKRITMSQKRGNTNYDVMALEGY